MQERMPIIISKRAIAKFIEYCKEHQIKKYLVVADENTALVLGNDVHKALTENDWDVDYCVLDPRGLIADGTAVTRTLDMYDASPRLFVAVGSGTITDITRFSSHRSQNQFVSFPTAASVDAYTSKNAAMTIGRLKGSVYCHAPIAIFTDMQTICASPKFLTASGFGDLICKLTSTCDWKISHLIWETPFDEDIYKRGIQAGQSVVNVIDGVKLSDIESMQVMMESQFESGFCMADFNNSAPASGSEHHIAHIWEMLFHWNGKSGLMHGNAVGIAAIISAEWYQRLRELSKEEAASLLAQKKIQKRNEQVAKLREALPNIAEEIEKRNPIYMQLSDEKNFRIIRKRILDNWNEIQECVELVPTPNEIATWIKNLGGPINPAEIELTTKQVELGKEYGHYLRERFSINIIRKIFGWV